jgi:hypothetical protein
MLVLDNILFLHVSPPNGPELRCGDVQPVPCRIYARLASPFLKKFFRAAKSSTATSVSLSDWLGSKIVMIHRETFFHALFLLVGLTFTLGNEVAQTTLYV